MKLESEELCSHPESKLCDYEQVTSYAPMSGMAKKRNRVHCSFHSFKQ
jgi:hypothetical protein